MALSCLSTLGGCGFVSSFSGQDHTYSSMPQAPDPRPAQAQPNDTYPVQYPNNPQASPPAAAQPAMPAYRQSERAAERAQFDNGSDLGEGPGSRAPSINVFGEFDGVERPAQKSVAMGGFQQHTYCDEGYDADACLDPTGHFVAYASTRHSEHTNIYMQRVDGLSVTQLTSEDADDAFPAFSPDGRLIAFSSTRGGNWNLYVMNADGRNVTQITSGPNQDLHPSFSPDGSRLVYCSMGPRGSQWELWIVNLQTNEKKMVGVGLFPSWSPQKDRDVIAFQRARQRGSRWFSIWTMEVADGEAHSVTEVAVSGNAALVCPSWSPDGMRLAFSTIVSPSHVDGRKLTGQQDIWTVNADGTNRHRLTDGNGINASPYWGCDERVYFVSDRGGTECIWSTPANAPGTSVAAVSRAGVAPQMISPQMMSPQMMSPQMMSPRPADPMASMPAMNVAPIASGTTMPGSVGEPANAGAGNSAVGPSGAATGSAPANSLGETDDTEIGH
jgi:Tol biopolymer transport system component